MRDWLLTMQDRLGFWWDDLTIGLCGWFGHRVHWCRPAVYGPEWRIGLHCTRCRATFYAPPPKRFSGPCGLDWSPIHGHAPATASPRGEGDER